MELIALDWELSVCKLRDAARIDWSGGFACLCATGEEFSLVCESRAVPPGALAVEGGWRAFRVAGTLDFGMTGVIAGISAALAEAGVSLFVVSTYDTDYVLLRAGDFERGMAALQKKGYAVREA